MVTRVTETKVTDWLSRIVATKEEELEAVRPRLAELRSRAADSAPPRDFIGALRRPGEVRLLAEIKRRSPSAGLIRGDVDPVDVARAYAEGGAAALSVLTDEVYFGGNLSALERVRGAVELPLLRKDFLIEEVQVWEARAAGADAVLLIVRILDDARLAGLHALAHELGMATLVETHDPSELERALAIGAQCIGINNRDLDTFRTDLGLAIGLAPEIDPAVTLVGESGIRTADDVRRLGAAGVDAILVGESLMRQADLAMAAAALCGHPRDPNARTGAR